MRKLVFAIATLLSLSAFAEPKTLVDTEWVIKANQSKGEIIKLTEDKPVKVVVEGVQDAKKGFRVRVLPAKVYRDFQDGKVTAKALADYPSSVQVMYKQTQKFKAGEWAIIVENNENMFKSMSVRVKMVVDPKNADE